jgi:hypothetical protein
MTTNTGRAAGDIGSVSQQRRRDWSGSVRIAVRETTRHLDHGPAPRGWLTDGPHGRQPNRREGLD